MDAPLRIVDRPSAVGFDFTSRMRTLCQDIVARAPAMAHIQLPRVLIAFSQARKGVQHGLQASLTPLRFAGGSLTTRRRNSTYTLQRIYDPNGREYLYILTFYLPRFLNNSLKEKLTTVFHELWHIGPSCDGDLRRHGGRCYAHSSSQKEYDAHMWQLAQDWLRRAPPSPLYDFLELPFEELQSRYGRIFGLKVPRPKLIPVN